MDADDIALADRLRKQISVMEANPDIVVLGAALSYIDAIGKDLGIIRYSETGRSLLLKNPMLHPTVAIRHSALRENQFLYQENYRYAEDYFLWLQLSRAGRLGAIDDVVLKYRVSRGASRVRHLKGMIRATLKVKIDGIRCLGINPKATDIFRFLLETLLLLMPSLLVFWIYRNLTFGRGCEVKL
jgi:hypothetical protein